MYRVQKAQLFPPKSRVLQVLKYLRKFLEDNRSDLNRLYRLDPQEWDTLIAGAIHIIESSTPLRSYYNNLLAKVWFMSLDLRDDVNDGDVYPDHIRKEIMAVYDEIREHINK